MPCYPGTGKGHEVSLPDQKEREREREEMCIVHIPGRSLKSETIREDL